MFSSKDLISFVFANEHDTYYGDDLLQRNLNQYLWERLHGNYEAVYFLSAEGSSFRVRSYGDLCCSEYTPGKKKLFAFKGGSEQEEQGNWLQRQLRARTDATAAFVCSMDDFCSVLSDQRWQPVLDAIAEENKRTGIFVLTAPATAERTRELLLTSPVFDRLRETAVTDLRGGTARDLYASLKKRKWDSCVFLNTFNYERIHGLLVHLVMSDRERCVSCEQLDQMTEYLLAYLRDPEFARAEGLLPEETPLEYWMYGELYQWLSNPRNWKKFQARCEAFCQSSYNCANQHSPQVGVLRDLNGYAGRCMKIKLPKWLQNYAEAWEEAQSLLAAIRREVAAPKNRMENQQIVAHAQKLLNQLEAVLDGDVDSYLWILEGLKFCVTEIYETEDQEKTKRILDVLEQIQAAVSEFERCFSLERNVSHLRAHTKEGSLQSITLKTLSSELLALEQQKAGYFDLVRATALSLQMPVKAGTQDGGKTDLGTAVDDFVKILESMQNPKLPVADVVDDPVPESEPEPEPEKEENTEFEFSSDWYSFIPPTN